jgi:Holliday junction DNA helicase RuvA
MIGRLKGVIDEYGDDHVIIDVGGVGYHVSCSTKTLAALPSKGEAAVLHTEMLVSENSIRLVGFATEAERGWFRLLDNVQGVGTKVALAILSTLDANELTNAIALGDKAMVGRANGVGPKLAQRIVTELKDKAPAFTGADPRLQPCPARWMLPGPRQRRKRCPRWSTLATASHRPVRRCPPRCARRARTPPPKR